MWCSCVLLWRLCISFSEQVQKCIKALEVAETDMERFATLFIIPKLISACDCDKNARISLMKVTHANYLDKEFAIIFLPIPNVLQGIGYSFLARMLRSKDSPDGCPKLLYQSVALSVLSCFSQDEEIMTHPSVSWDEFR